jgi:hypothetical protein
MRNLFVSLYLCCAAVVLAVEPSVTFDIQPRIIKLGEAATATLQFHGIDNPNNPGFPPLDGFQVQSAGTESSFTINNGAQDSSISVKYTLIPQRVGKTNIGPFSYDDGKGHKFDLPGVMIEVVNPGSSAQSAQDLLFARLEPSSTNLYVQQVFDLTLKIYASTKLNLHGVQPLQNLPAQGLMIHQPQQLDTQREAVNGEIYTVYRFSLRAQALTAGRYDLAPTERAEILAPQRRQRNPFGDAFFDSFFGTVQTETRDINVQPVTLVIKDLPTEGRPANFAGAVGKFTFEMTCKPLVLSAGDPITLGYRISGRGNIDSVQMPTLQLGADFKSYDAKLTSQNINDQTATGEKTFEQVVIPRADSVKAFPEVSFSFFDPDVNAYQSVKRGPFALVVHPSAKSVVLENQAAPSDATQKAQMLGSDIVYLKSAPAAWLTEIDIPWYAKRGTMIAQTVPAIAVAATFLLVRRREKVAGDIARTRRQMAPKAARAGIERARGAITQNDVKQFYEALWEAMSSYFGNRLNLLPGDVSSDRIDTAFARANFTGDERQLVRNLFESCERARFGGVEKFDPAIAQKQIAELADALRACEKISL